MTLTPRASFPLRRLPRPDAARRRPRSSPSPPPLPQPPQRWRPLRGGEGRKRLRRTPPPLPPQPTPARGGARAANIVEPVPQRARGGRATVTDKKPPQVGEPGGPSHRPGDVPASLTRRYFTEALRGGAVVAFYEGPGAKAVAFHDHGTRLATDQTHPAVVRDLAAIAEHRGWRAIQVKGEDDFRREVWLEARARGLEVKGYKPRERDQQELDRRLDGARTADKAPSPPAPRPTERSSDPRETRTPQPERPDYDVGVAGVLLAAGQAPYRRRAGEPSTPFIRLDRGDGRALDVWGVGLPDALARSGAKVGDAVRVRRDGVDVVQRTVEVRDRKTGTTTAQQRDVSRNRWVIEAERFRQASPGQAARDPDLRGAQSHLAVLNTVIDRSVKDPEGRQRLRAEAREIVAGELAQGRRFTPARVREVEPVLARDVAEARRHDAEPERARRR